MLWLLFWTFLKIGFVSFGGGYAMIPLIEHEALANQWLGEQQFIDSITLAGMAPGPIAMNSAIVVGYNSANLGGAIAAALGIIFPSLLLMVVAAAWLNKMYNRPVIQSAFYGMRPVVTSLIIYAAVRLGWNDIHLARFSRHDAAAIFILAIVFILLMRYRMHPIYAIILSGGLGMFLFS